MYDSFSFLPPPPPNYHMVQQCAILKLITRPSTDGARKLCTVTSNLAGVQDHEMVMKRKARRFFFKGKKFYLCTFEVRAIVAPADIRFELWFAGNRFSKNHESIKIAWNANGVKG